MYSVGINGKLQCNLGWIVFVLCFVWQEPEALEISHKGVPRDNGIERIYCVEEALNKSFSFCLSWKASHDFDEPTRVTPVVLYTQQSVSLTNELMHVMMRWLVSDFRVRTYGRDVQC
jgi:hypothetical protein